MSTNDSLDHQKPECKNHKQCIVGRKDAKKQCAKKSQQQMYLICKFHLLTALYFSAGKAQAPDTQRWATVPLWQALEMALQTHPLTKGERVCSSLPLRPHSLKTVDRALGPGHAARIGVRAVFKQNCGS